MGYFLGPFLLDTLPHKKTGYPFNYSSFDCIQIEGKFQEVNVLKLNLHQALKSFAN